MTPHTHREFVPGCFRCDLSRDEVAHAVTPGREDVAMEAAGRFEKEEGAGQ